MGVMKLSVVAVALLALAAVPGCTPRPLAADELVAMCQAEANPGGTYEYDVGTPIPVMRPIEDGTEFGARIFNACIRSKAANAGMMPAASARGHTGAICPKADAVLYRGTLYCIRVN